VNTHCVQAGSGSHAGHIYSGSGLKEGGVFGIGFLFKDVLDGASRCPGLD
jgi:hypothetical protein